ncbi:prepilin peptidase [Candidatus Woesearchaeota archaeon]|nr:prepilin peptidase [Candidatus Woesearchaeota archaeon]
MIPEVAYPLALIALIVASYVDIRIREVPDWISYGLLFAGIGIRLIYAAAYDSWTIVLEGIAGLGLMFAIASAFFYTGQWGGGDSKLLVGLGALFGITWQPIQFMTIFLLLLFAVGAVYGLFWSFYLYVANRQKCQHYFVELHKRGAGGRMWILAGAAGLLLIGLLVANLFSLFFIATAVSIVLLYYVWLFLHVLEKTCMYRSVFPSQLTEGDWIVDDIMVDGKRVCGPGDLGISKEQIMLLKRYHQEKKVDTVLIKDGIPFVPSFLIAYCILLGLRTVVF